MSIVIHAITFSKILDVQIPFLNDVCLVYSCLFIFWVSANKRLVYEEVKKAVERDRSLVKVSELSRHGLMEITRKRV